MTLLDHLNRSNAGRSILMFKDEYYTGNRHTPYVTRAYLRMESYRSSAKLTPVEIHHLEEDRSQRAIEIYLLLDGEIVRHYEPGINLDYGSLQLNENFELIGATTWDWSVWPNKKIPYIFPEVI